MAGTKVRRAGLVTALFGATSALVIGTLSVVLGPAGAQAAQTASTADSGGAGNPHYCDGCSPPLVYSNGPVLDTSSDAGLTITPIYWVPAGSSYSFPARYQQILNTFLTNVAAASGEADNFNSVDTEYYQVSGGATMYVTYHFTAGSPVTDSNPFPSSGCKLASGATVCLTDQQLRSELVRLTSAMNLPTDLAHLYALFLPNGVEVTDRDGSNSASDFCGYHRGFAVGQGELVYAVMPYEPTGCDAGEAPNGDIVADAGVSVLAHEISEAVTDPEDQITTWNDSSGSEIADICANSYGPPLGSTSSAHPDTTEYNQIINGGKYYIQEMFSNHSYATFGTGHGCVQNEALAQHPTSASAVAVTSIYSEATPTRLPADGSSTTSVDVSVGDNNGDAVTGDLVTFQTRTRAGSGRCGRLSSRSGRTGSGGDVMVTYTASASNIQCEITAVEAQGGLSASSVIYQGSAEQLSPTINARFPATVRAGGPPVTFSVVANNPSRVGIAATQVVVDLYQGGSASGLVKASQIHLAYSTNGAAGPFSPVALSGTTAPGDSIEGFAGPPQGSLLPARSSQSYTFQLSVDAGVPKERKGQPLLSTEAYLDQVDSASGSGTTLDDSFASDLHITHR